MLYFTFDPLNKTLTLHQNKKQLVLELFKDKYKDLIRTFENYVIYDEINAIVENILRNLVVIKQIALDWGIGILYNISAISKITAVETVELSVCATNFMYSLLSKIALQVKNLSQIKMHSSQIETGLPDMSSPLNQLLEVTDTDTDEIPPEFIDPVPTKIEKKCPTLAPYYCTSDSVFRTTIGRGNVSPCVRDHSECNKSYAEVQHAIHNVIYPTWSKKCTSKKIAIGDSCNDD